LIGFVHVTAEGFLHEDMLARFKGFDSPRHMQRMRRPDQNGVEGVICYNCVIVLCPTGNVELLGLMLESMLFSAAQYNNLKIVAFNEVWKVHPTNDATCTDNT